MHNTSKLYRLASNKIGMRRILKTRLPPVDYIKKAVQTGIYKKIYYPDGIVNTKNNRGRGGDFGGGDDDQAHHRLPKINPYPEEYEILTLNPPLPMKPRLSRKDYRFLKMERKLKEKEELERQQRENDTGGDGGYAIKKKNHFLKTLPTTDRLIKQYMQRYDERMHSASHLTDSQREEEYYQSILGINNNTAGTNNNNDFNSAMGRKSAVLNHAYEFALKQYQVLSDSYNSDQEAPISEEDSIKIVEELLAKEEKDERLESRKRAQQLVKDFEDKQKELEEATGTTNSSSTSSTATATSSSSSLPPSSTIPSILFSKPRTIQALHIWGKRLQAVPYNQWTLGATTALDHWIAVDVLGMKEETWNRLLNGELEMDIQDTHGGGLNDVLIGDKARLRDIVTVRSTMFPETVIHSMDDEEEVMKMREEFGDAEDALKNLDDVDKSSAKDDTERSIDELLASLGDFEEEDDDDNNDDESEQEGDSDVSFSSNYYEDNDLDTRISHMVDTLQEWRQKNVEIPFEEWDDITKQDFNKWLSDYISLVTTENDGEVDMVATRKALLSEAPLSRTQSQSFWAQVQDEADAEILLHSLLENGLPPAPSGEESAIEKQIREELETFLSLPHDTQLRQLINLGTLQPILDEYYKESDRMKFMSQYGQMLLEGVEIEHLVLDQENGNITLDDIGGGSEFFRKDEIGKTIDLSSKFSIKKMEYGTDEYGSKRSERARMLYRIWNMHKAGRARYAESQFKKGKMPLKDDSHGD